MTTELQRRRDLTKLTKPQLIDLLVHAERLATGEPGSVSPDCRDGKHRACIGDAWNDAEDGPDECRCSCHEEPRP